MPLGVLVTDMSGQIVGGNAALHTLLNLQAGALSGRTLADLAADGSDEQARQALEVLAHAGRPQPYVKELVDSGGDVQPFELATGALLDAAGKPGHAVITVKPLSEEMKLLQKLQRRNMHLIASSEVAKAATQILDIQELLTRCVDLIRTHFGFYYAAIFLIDEAGEWAVLRAATGEAGEKLLAQGHRLGVGSQSMVGWVTANNAARIALDVGEEAIRFNNPLLPKTRSEMALPLRVRGEVIGALDTQSTSVNAFTPEDIQTIQMMADQVAIAIDNARMFSMRGSK
jgi:PAS domain S-box-containing protein